MKWPSLALYTFLALFSFSVFAEDDFGDDPAPSTTPPAGDVTTPPSEAGDYNKELTDAVGDEEPKVPEPEAQPKKTPTHVDPAEHVKKEKPAKAKKAKKEKEKKKDKKGSKKEKAGKKGSKKDKKGKKDKAGKKKKKSKSAEGP